MFKIEEDIEEAVYSCQIEEIKNLWKKKTLIFVSLKKKNLFLGEIYWSEILMAFKN